jgi:hypothetical protein
MFMNLVVSAKTRGFIIVTGCLTSAAGFALGLGVGFVFPAALLIAGALVQPKFHRLGRGLICAGAILLSFLVFWVGFLLLSEPAPDGIKMADVVEAFSAILVAVCDVAIIKEEIRIRRAERTVKSALTAASV